MPQNVENCGRSSRNFFEILRFDFILDENLKIHLMEINMSPNLGAIRDQGDIKRNYRSQLIYDTLNILSLTTSKLLHKRENSFIISDEKDVIAPSVKGTDNCNCLHVDCKMCLKYHDDIQQFYREHVRRGRMKRIFPLKKHHDVHLISHATPSNKFSIEWFNEMCSANNEWC